MKEDGKAHAVVTFRENRSGDWCMKIQRLKNFKKKEREREEKNNPNFDSDPSGPKDWTCGLCCNFNFKSKAVCNRAGCNQTQEVRGGRAKRAFEGDGVVVPMMEIYPMHTCHMICDLHYGDRRSD